MERRNLHPPQTTHGTKKPQYSPRRQTTNHTNQRTTIRILKPKTAMERIHLKYWHPQGRHDDQLHALALATYAAKTKEPEAILMRAY